jgi:formylglycine-generating enzyme required for sulfatase activity
VREVGPDEELLDRRFDSLEPEPQTVEDLVLGEADCPDPQICLLHADWEECSVVKCESNWGGQWIAVPGGTFVMGCSADDGTCEKDESPPHPVAITAFYMLETEVTLAQYEFLMGYHEQQNDTLAFYLYGIRSANDWPAINVTRDNASTFCALAGGRLPTEAEWEYAARGGVTSKFYCGSDIKCLALIAWYQANSEWHLHSAGGKKANPYGLYDMLGNAREWTGDSYGKDYYASSPVQDPAGPGQGPLGVSRGGSFETGTEGMSVSRRQALLPSSARDHLSFRCVKAVPAR